MATPSQILKKSKTPDTKTDKKPDTDKDDGKKAPRRSALIDFIAKHKK